MKTKMILVSVTYHGAMLSLFVNVPEGTRRISADLLNKMAGSLGAIDRGVTFSIG